MLKYWKELKILEDPITFQVREEHILFNDHILVNRKTLYFTKWYDWGITYIHDLLNDDGEKCSKQNGHIDLGFELQITFLSAIEANYYFFNMVFCKGMFQN